MGGGKGIKGHGMERERLGALVILGVLSLARGDPPDWCHLRVGGLVVAAVLSVVGIIVLFSGMCKCRSKASRRRPPPELSPVPGTGECPLLLGTFGDIWGQCHPDPHPSLRRSHQLVLSCPQMSPNEVTQEGGGSGFIWGLNSFPKCPQNVPKCPQNVPGKDNE
ncbi:uncharacterized protein LOC117002246 isoform X2 [Catharus ustulatus]|uniref:uncharacterized protein LOC117002246 isoform X2 n=1 Tax=Catharus ustulatus TaxID=91951 RepID=UPI00140C5C15|nr:uncharacterized protein LOC117002246 isoform X2 [Catharus ustulatus]